MITRTLSLLSISIRSIFVNTHIQQIMFNYRIRFFEKKNLKNPVMFENSNVCLICICRERFSFKKKLGKGMIPNRWGTTTPFQKGCPLTGLGSSSRSMASGAFWSITQQHPRITWWTVLFDDGGVVTQTQSSSAIAGKSTWDIITNIDTVPKG